MAKNSPVNIWINKHNPRRDPKFHHSEILLGLGRSISELFMILMRGCFFRMGLFILYF